MQRERFFDRALVRGPTLHGYQAGLAGDDAAFRDRFKKGDAVGARYGDQFRVGIHCDPGFHIWGVLARLGRIQSGAHGADLGQAQRRVQRNQARVQMLSAQIDDFGAWRGKRLADGCDFSILHKDLSRKERLARNRVHGRSGQKKRLSAGARHRHLRQQSGHEEGTNITAAR